MKEGLIEHLNSLVSALRADVLGKYEADIRVERNLPVAISSMVQQVEAAMAARQKEIQELQRIRQVLYQLRVLLQ